MFLDYFRSIDGSGLLLRQVNLNFWKLLNCFRSMRKLLDF